MTVKRKKCLEIYPVESSLLRGAKQFNRVKKVKKWNTKIEVTNCDHKNKMKENNANNKIILYKTEDGRTEIEVNLEGETVWLSQKQMAELFDCSVDNISLHLKNVYSEGELTEKATVEDFSIVQKEGNRSINRQIKLYNLDAIISVGYRINSLRGTQFRIWATQKLREYIVKGFVMDDERLSDGGVKKSFFALIYIPAL